MVNRLDEEHLCLCPPIKLLTNNLLNSLKELTELGGILLNHMRKPFEGGWKGSTHYLVWNPLKVHCSFVSGDVIKVITRPVV